MAPEEYLHWRMEEDGDGIVWLTFDRAGRSVNTLSREALEELGRILDGLAGRSMRGLVLRSGKASGFIAGADVTEFAGIADAEEALHLIERGQEIIGRIERLPVPTVALIRGFCLGGGLELALACRHRVAADTPETRMGLPEVKLGIHPGFGGTVRLPRLLGPVAALELMLTGKTVDARKARRIGLVEWAVPERHLENAGRAAILHPPPPARHGFFYFLAGMWFMRPLLARYLRHTVAGRAGREHYPAPYALVDLWERFGNDPDAMCLEEARSVARLVTGSSSRSLVRVFLLQERLRSLGRGVAPSVRHVHVVGGGTMGGDIAAWCALQGMVVTVEDVDRGRLSAVVRRARELFGKNLRKPREIEAALDRLVPDVRGEGVSRADVVIEAIFEDAEAKRELYRRIEPRMQPGAVLATNTSSIPLEDLSVVLARPGRLVGLHFFNPVARMQLVEMVTADGSDPEAVARGTAFVGAIDRLPLPVASSPGFLVNRILMPYLLEAVIMESEGIPAAEIDRSAVGFGMPMGPLLLADTVGLDICLSVARVMAGQSGCEVPPRLEELVAAGRFGRKSGHGFYVHGRGRPALPRVRGGEGGDVADRLILRLLNEAVACRREGVAADDDLIDAGVVFGTGFAPFRGGPLHYIRTEGAGVLHGRLKLLEACYGSRFAADAGWQEMLEEESGSSARKDGS